MIEFETIPYAPPDNPVGPNDHFYLRTLAYCHWAFGAFTAFGGVMLCIMVEQRNARIFGGGVILFGVLIAVSGLFLTIKRFSWFILCVSALTVLSMPFGTILGISTIAVLRRSGVHKIFLDEERARTDGAAV